MVYCNYKPELCQAENKESKFNCIKGYMGPLCESCDVFGEIWNERYGENGFLNCFPCK